MPQLHAVMYHYVRDLSRTAFPRIKGMSCDGFYAQVEWLRAHFEMATLEAGIEFLQGRYRPKRDLCLLTFDDALKDHSKNVLPILSDRKIQGIFGIITGSVEEHTVAPVHMNHFLAASLDFAEYRSRFLAKLRETAPSVAAVLRVDANEAQRSYPLDTREEAVFKFLVNFVVPGDLRDRVIRELFTEHLGAEEEFAKQLYMSWSEIRELQLNGMAIAGHTHQHRPLSALTPGELQKDIQTCRALLDRNIRSQGLFPFSYPYGKRNSYSTDVIGELRNAGFHCAFDTESGSNLTGCDLYALHRIDCNGATDRLRTGAFSRRASVA
jgi:peptidoglycan/xylan/chitin deacetylase (PgdA/CDA1 family)